MEFDINDIDDTVYCIESIEVDIDNGNFSEDDLESYSFESIVQTSIINGQIKQAKQQADYYGLDFGTQFHKAKGYYYE